MAKEVVIRESDWRVELERVMCRSGDEGQTAVEISKNMKISLPAARKLLSRLLDEGRLIRGFRIQESLDGSMRRRPVYRIKKGKP